jgi:hypothetical protein
MLSKLAKYFDNDQARIMVPILEHLDDMRNSLANYMTKGRFNRPSAVTPSCFVQPTMRSKLDKS